MTTAILIETDQESRTRDKVKEERIEREVVRAGRERIGARSRCHTSVVGEAAIGSAATQISEGRGDE